MLWGDTFSILEGVQYLGRCLVLRRDTISTVAEYRAFFKKLLVGGGANSKKGTMGEFGLVMVCQRHTRNGRRPLPKAAGGLGGAGNSPAGAG